MSSMGILQSASTELKQVIEEKFKEAVQNHDQHNIER